MSKELILYSRIKCPRCGHEEEEKMSPYTTMSIHTCTRCKEKLVAPEDSCCIFCLYGSTRCPDAQKRSKSDK